MENRVVTPVNGISTVDVRGNGISIAAIRAEDIDLVRSGMSAKKRFFVDVICVALVPPGMVCCESKRIEVLSDRDDSCQVIIPFEPGKARFDQIPGERERVVGLHVEFPPEL